MDSLTHNIYEDGSYLANNPTWHEEDAPFKAKYISELLHKNSISFQSIAEIGCGTGAVLKTVNKFYDNDDAEWKGFDIAGDAIAIAQRDQNNNRIQFFQKDLLETDEYFDVLLVIDVFEHVPDYMGFVQKCRQKARYKIYHIPLDLHVSSVLRDSFMNARLSVGHLHYFSQKTALATLTDTGHEIMDIMLTPGAIELFRLHPSIKRAAANLPRMIVGSVNPSLSARLFGGYSFLVLTQ